MSFVSDPAPWRRHSVFYGRRYIPGYVTFRTIESGQGEAVVRFNTYNVAGEGRSQTIYSVLPQITTVFLHSSVGGNIVHETTKIRDLTSLSNTQLELWGYNFAELPIAREHTNTLHVYVSGNSGVFDSSMYKRVTLNTSLTSKFPPFDAIEVDHTRIPVIDKTKSVTRVSPQSIVYTYKNKLKFRLPYIFEQHGCVDVIVANAVGYTTLRTLTNDLVCAPEPTPTPSPSLTPVPTPTHGPTQTPTPTPVPTIPCPSDDIQLVITTDSNCGCPVSVEWTHPHANTGGYILYRKVNSRDWVELYDWKVTSPWLNKTKKYIDSDVDCKDTYQYKVKVYNDRCDYEFGPVGLMIPTCTPTPTPTPTYMSVEFSLCEPTPTPTPSPTPTLVADEFDLCFTPTPTPTMVVDEFDRCFITPTPSPTPTPTYVAAEFDLCNITPTPTYTPTPTPTFTVTPTPTPTFTVTPTPTPTPTYVAEEFDRCVITPTPSPTPTPTELCQLKQPEQFVNSDITVVTSDVLLVPQLYKDWNIPASAVDSDSISAGKLNSMSYYHTYMMWQYIDTVSYNTYRVEVHTDEEIVMFFNTEVQWSDGNVSSWNKVTGTFDIRTTLQTPTIAGFVVHNNTGLSYCQLRDVEACVPTQTPTPTPTIVVDEFDRCVITPTPSVTPTPTPTFTPTPTPTPTYSPTPTPTPTLVADEFDLCFTPTPTPTPTFSPTPTPTYSPTPTPTFTVTPTPTLTPTPTPTHTVTPTPTYSPTPTPTFTVTPTTTPTPTPTPTFTVTPTPTFTPTPTPTFTVTPSPTPTKGQTTWNASQITDVDIWLDASDTSTIDKYTEPTSGLIENRVVSWNSLSGTVALTPLHNNSNGPKTETTTVNGLNVLSFDGVEDALIVDNYTLPDNFSMLIVSRMDVDSEFDGLVSYGWKSSNTVGEDTRFELVAGSKTEFKGKLNTTGIAVVTDNVELTTQAQEAGIHEIIFDSSAGMLSVYTNTLLGASISIDTKLDSRNKRLFLFSNSEWWNPGNQPSGDIYEFIIVPRVITLNEQAALQGYLINKWGLQDNLPLSHPYRSQRPTLENINDINYIGPPTSLGNNQIVTVGLSELSRGFKLDGNAATLRIDGADYTVENRNNTLIWNDGVNEQVISKPGDYITFKIANQYYQLTFDSIGSIYFSFKPIPSPTPTPTPTPTPSPTPTARLVEFGECVTTPTPTPTPTYTVTPTPTYTVTPTPTPTPTNHCVEYDLCDQYTPTPTPTPTNHCVEYDTCLTPTPTPTLTPTPTNHCVEYDTCTTPTPTPTLTPTPTNHCVEYDTCTTPTPTPTDRCIEYDTCTTSTPTPTPTSTVTPTPTPTPTSFDGLDFNLEFDSRYTDAQRNIIITAVSRWREIIKIHDLTYTLNCELHDSGPGGGLAFAGPTMINVETKLPTSGRMSFDLQDLNGSGANLDGQIIPGTGYSKMYYTALHEIAHALGLGTFWQLAIYYSNGQPLLERNWLYDAVTMQPLPDDADLLTGSERPIYVGPVGSAGVREFNKIANITALGVPIEDDGGPGTALGHLEEGHETISIPLADGSYIMTETGMGNEIMTGWIDSGDMPISKITVGMLEDIGWSVNYNAADPFTLDL